MNTEMLDILIGKYLDSEITPAEQALLARQLDGDPQARVLLEQFQQLDELAAQAVENQIQNRGDSFETIFNRAIRQYHPARQRFGRVRQSFGWVRRLRLPASLAAGFLLGLLSVLLYASREISSDSLSPSASAQSNATAVTPTPMAIPSHIARPMPQAPQQQRQTDLYTFTDPRGTQWLIESHRDSDIELAGYTDDL